MKKYQITFIAVTVVGLTIAVTPLAQQQTGAQNRQPAAGPNPAVIAKLEAIIEIRDRLFQGHESLVGAGRVPADSSAEVDLVEARLNLARERNQTNEVLAELKKLVAAQERRLRRIHGVRSEFITPADVERAKVGLLEAEIRLLKEQ